MQVSGQISRSGFTLHFTGEGTLARLQPVARDIAQLHALDSLASKGTAQTDLTFSSPWILPVTEETGASVQGWVRLQHAEIQPAWLHDPIQIATATAQLGNGTITWANAGISVHGIDAKGSASYPAPCNDPSGCAAQVDLDFPTLDAADLQSTIFGASHGEFLQAILSQVESPTPPWPRLNATLHAATFSLGRLKLKNARASINVHSGGLDIVSLDAGALGGSTHVTGSIQTADGPKYALNLTWTGVKLAQAASLFPEKGAAEDWGTGSIDGQTNLNLHGYSGLATTATGDFRWIVNGNWGGSWTASPTQPSLRNASLSASRSYASAEPLHGPWPNSSTNSWTAAGTIANQTLTLNKGPLQGTITFDRKLDLVWVRTQPGTRAAAAPPSLRITGTLAHPIAATPPPPSPAKPAAQQPRIR